MLEENSNSDLTVEIIAKLRKQLREIIAPNFKKSPEESNEIFRQKLNIVTDAMAFVILKTSKSFSTLDIQKNSILGGEFVKNIAPSLFLKIANIRITFQNVVDAARTELNISSAILPDPDGIVNHTSLKDKPDIRTAIEMYLLRGHFKWVNHNESDFKGYIFEPKTKTLPEDAKINCWEAVLYGMMQANVLSRNTLQNYYKGTITDTETKLGGWFDFKHCKIISDDGEPDKNWREELKTDSYLIMTGKKHGWGLKHDMVSFPYSQKQLLKMMITEKFDEMPSKPKLFSHWVNWTGGTIGTVKKDNFGEELFEPDQDIRIVSLKKLAQRSRNLSVI